MKNLAVASTATGLMLLGLALIGAGLSAGCASSSTRHSLAVEYYNLGNAYYRIQRYEEAIRYFSKAIEQDPSLLHAHHNLSLVLIKQGRGEEATGILMELLEETPENTSVLQLIGYAYYVQGESGRALEYFDRVLEREPHNLEARYNRAIVLWDLNRKGEAEDIFRSLLDDLPEEAGTLYTDTLFNLGKLLFELGRYEEAIHRFESYLEWESGDLQARIRLAESYREAERYGDAIEVYADVVEKDKDQPGVWMDMAEIYLAEIEDPVPGIEALKRAVNLGFEDRQRLEKLLNDPKLIERDAVEEVLRTADLLP